MRIKGRTRPDAPSFRDDLSPWRLIHRDLLGLQISNSTSWDIRLITSASYPAT